jgi:hypothetical protein
LPAIHVKPWFGQLISDIQPCTSRANTCSPVAPSSGAALLILSMHCLLR